MINKKLPIFHGFKKCKSMQQDANSEVFTESRETYFGFLKKGLELVPFISGNTVNFRVGLKQKMPEIH